MDNKLPKIIVIVGPTASGKTDLAIKIALRLRSGQARKLCIKGAEIVSADSRQVYKGMDIGTAKPAWDRSNISRMKSNESDVRHHCVDIKNPNEEYTVAEFKKDAVKAINDILKCGKLPILAGGTGLYIKAVTENLEIPSVKPNHALRQKLEKRIEKEGLETIYRELVEQDPEAAYIVDGKNPRRVIRAMEIAILTKKPFSSQRKKGRKLFDALKIGIKLPDIELKKRIEKRANIMVKKGLVDEVKKLVKKYGERQIAFDAIGYKEIIAFLKKETSLEEAIGSIKRNTNYFAKRQMTWFRKDKDIKWVSDRNEAMRLVKKFLSG